MLVWAASSNNTAESKYDMLVSSMTIITDNSCVLLVHITSTHRPGSDATIDKRSISKNLPTITQDLSRRGIATSGESVSTYPRRPKVEAFSNAVDVLKRLHDPTDPSTEPTAPPRSAHVQLSDVPRTLDPVETEGEFRQHDGVVTVMMKLPTQGFA